VDSKILKDIKIKKYSEDPHWASFEQVLNTKMVDFSLRVERVQISTM